MSPLPAIPSSDTTPKSLLIPYVAPEYISQNLDASRIPNFVFPLRMQYLLANQTETPESGTFVRPPPTPVQRLTLPNSSLSPLLKRDDLTDLILSGNKSRKLEFLIGEALSQNYGGIITTGGSQSNHCRATAIAAQKAGLKCHLILRLDSETTTLSGNLLLDALMGATIWTVSKEDYEKYGQHALLEHLRVKLLNEQNLSCLVAPSGGSNATGLFGYIECFEEIRQQLGDSHMRQLKYIIVPTGSGGTITGLAVACALAGYSNIKIVGMAVCDDAAYFYDHVDEMLEKLGLSDRFKARDIVQVWDMYKGVGYAESTKEELALLVELARKNGIVFDPVYSGKAANGLVHDERLQQCSSNEIMFIHTGGLFGMWAKSEQLKKEELVDMPRELDLSGIEGE